jgi:hypothetical protein
MQSREVRPMDIRPPQFRCSAAVRRGATVSLLLTMLAGCAASGDGGTPQPAASDPALTSAPMLPAALQLFPQCEAEIRAFIEMTRFARSFGDNWQLFSDAIDAMKAQVVACVDDGQEAAAWRVPDDRPSPPPSAARRRAPR